jgi:hypothetical protein
MRHRTIGCAVAVVIAVAGSAAAQDPTFAGTWKLNMSKSQLTGQTVKFEKKPDGLITFDSQGFKYDFSLDGKEHPTPDGGTTAWKQVNATTWDATQRANGKVIGTYHSVVKGDSLALVIKMTKPDGTLSDDMTSNWTRMSGGPGFFGTWKSTEVKGAAPGIELALKGATGITFNIPDAQMACTGSFDGKDYPVAMAGKPIKQTLAFERQGAKAFKITTKIDGKPYYTDVFTLSADGKTLTDEGMPTAANEPSKLVYERQ